MRALLIAVCLLFGCAKADVKEANRLAREFAQKVPGATSVQCNDSDSDQDGYVSCTVFRGERDPLPIQCGAEQWCVVNCAHGCKYVPIKLPPSQ